MKQGPIAVAQVLGPVRSVVVGWVLLFASGWLLVAVSYGAIPVGPGLTTRIGGAAPGDFMFFYPAASLAAHGRMSETYDPSRLTDEGRHVLGARVPELVWPYPPTMSVILVPFGQLGPLPSYVLWATSLITALLLLGRLALGTWMLSPLVLLFPAAGLSLFASQFSPTFAAALAVCSAATVKPRLAGSALGFFALKPHLAIGPALLFASQRRWRDLSWAAVTAASLTVLSLLLFGLDAWQAFFSAGFRHMDAITIEAPLSRFVTAFAAIATFGASTSVAVVAHILISMVGLVAGALLWRYGSSASVRTLGLTATAVQLPPYALDYDMVLLALPWLLMIREALDDSAVATRLLGPWLMLTAVTPAGYLVQLYTQRSVVAPILFLTVALVCRQELANRTLADAAEPGGRAR